MGNVYILANDNSKLVDVTDMRPDKRKLAGYDREFIVHRAGEYNRAFEFAMDGTHPHIIATWFCGGCGGYIGVKNSCDCGCYEPQGGIPCSACEAGIEVRNAHISEKPISSTQFNNIYRICVDDGGHKFAYIQIESGGTPVSIVDMNDPVEQEGLTDEDFDKIQRAQIITVE